MNVEWILLFFVVLNCVLTVWSVRVLGLALERGISELDGMIAGAIKQVLEGDLAGSIEPPNPIQQALAHFLSQRLQNVPIEMSRAPDGKFSGEKIS